MTNSKPPKRDSWTDLEEMTVVGKRPQFIEQLSGIKLFAHGQLIPTPTAGEYLFAIINDGSVEMHIPIETYTSSKETEVTTVFDAGELIGAGHLIKNEMMMPENSFLRVKSDNATIDFITKEAYEKASMEDVRKWFLIVATGNENRRRSTLPPNDRLSHAALENLRVSDELIAQQREQITSLETKTRELLRQFNDVQEDLNFSMAETEKAKAKIDEVRVDLLGEREDRMEAAIQRDAALEELEAIKKRFNGFDQLPQKTLELLLNRFDALQKALEGQSRELNDIRETQSDQRIILMGIFERTLANSLEQGTSAKEFMSALKPLFNKLIEQTENERLQKFGRAGLGLIDAIKLDESQAPN